MEAQPTNPAERPETGSLVKEPEGFPQPVLTILRECLRESHKGRAPPPEPPRPALQISSRVPPGAWSKFPEPSIPQGGPDKAHRDAPLAPVLSKGVSNRRSPLPPLPFTTITMHPSDSKEQLFQELENMDETSSLRRVVRMMIGKKCQRIQGMRVTVMSDGRGGLYLLVPRAETGSIAQ